MKTSAITTVGHTDGQTMPIAGGSYRIVISGAQTNGAYAMIEMTVPVGGGPNPHAHPGIQESFYVLEGEVEFRSEQGRYVAKTGSFINIPYDGPVHFFKNRSQHTARLLCTVTPAGLEDFFREASQAAAGSVPDPNFMRALAEKYGQELYAADFLD